jgi:hypothetical protein
MVGLLPARNCMKPAPPASSTFEIAVGRTLAACLHPVAAWRLGAKGRLPMVLGYFLAGYVVGFVSLVGL